MSKGVSLLAVGFPVLYLDLLISPQLCHIWCKKIRAGWGAGKLCVYHEQLFGHPVLWSQSDGDD